MPDLAAFGPIENASYADLEDLASRQVREGMRLDFKATLGPLNDKARFELLKDVSAFANTRGGILVYGAAQDNNGAIASLPGIVLDDEDAAVNQLSSIISDNIEERIPGISINVIRSTEGRAFALIRVPRSPLAPHMITMPVTYPRFYYRANTLNAPMAVGQVKRASQAGKEREDEILSKIAHRIEQVGALESALQLFAMPLYADTYSLDITRESVIRQLMSISRVFGAVEALHTLAGYTVRYVSMTDRKHVLFMRDGSVEVLDSPIVQEGSNGVRTVSLHLVERECLELVRSLSQANVEGLAPPPLLFAVRLAGVRGTRYVGSSGGFSFPEGAPCSEDIVYPEPVVIHEWTNFDQSLKPLFDVIWQAFGVAKSPNYDDRGQRRS